MKIKFYVLICLLVVCSNTFADISYIPSGTLRKSGGTITGNLDVTGTIAAGSLTITTSLSLQKHYAQLSSLVTQSPGTTSPTLVLLDVNDEISGLTHSIGTSTESIYCNKTGVYCMLAGGQVGKTGAGGVTYLDLWFRKNNVDIPNSNVRNAIASSTDTKVVINNCVISLNAGDYINIMQSVSNAAVGCGLFYTAPAGEAAIPSIIFTMFEL